jgi:sulfur-oxidizing protein SoxY
MKNKPEHHMSGHSATRRDVLIGGFAGGLVATFSMNDAQATPEQMRAAIRNVVGEAEVRKGRVKLDTPPLVENGNTVSLVVIVDSPMTATDYVKSIHVFNEKNPQPNVIAVHLGPRSGKAKISTRFRLADSQTVTAIAEMSDGTFWSATADLIVTMAACVEGL